MQKCNMDYMCEVHNGENANIFLNIGQIREVPNITILHNSHTMACIYRVHTNNSEMPRSIALADMANEREHQS